MQGKIVKGISGFYYVHIAGSAIYECKAKGIFRNQKRKPLVGDTVEITVLNEADRIGNIEKLLPRANELIRPAVANIDQAIIIFAAAKPQPNFNLLDRFLVMMEYQKVPVTICFNKADLVQKEELESLLKIYASCGYPVVCTSAKEREGIDRLQKLLEGKTSAVADRPASESRRSSTVCRRSRWRPVRSAKRLRAESIRRVTQSFFRLRDILILWIHRGFLP